MIGIAVLRQIPTLAEIAGVALVVAGVALHRAPRAAPPRRYARSPASSHSHAGVLDGPRCGQPFMIASSCQ